MFRLEVDRWRSPVRDESPRSFRELSLTSIHATNRTAAQKASARKPTRRRAPDSPSGSPCSDRVSDRGPPRRCHPPFGQHRMTAGHSWGAEHEGLPDAGEASASGQAPTSCGGSARLDADRLRGLLAPSAARWPSREARWGRCFRLGRGGSTPVGP